MRTRMRSTFFWMLILLLCINVQFVSAGGYRTRIYNTTVKYDKGWFKLAPDGKSFGFSYYKNNQHFVQINKKIYGGFDIAPNSNPFLMFGPDGKTVIFSFYKDGKYFVQVNDKVFGGYDKFEPPFFSKTGKIYGFKYMRRQKWYIWINGKSYGGFTTIAMGNPVINQDETDFGFWYQKRSKWYLQTGEKKYGWYQSYWGPLFSLDGKNIGFIYQKKNNPKFYFRAGEEEFGPFDRIVQFTPGFDGKSFEVLYQNDGQCYLISGEKKTGPFNDLLFPQSKDGKIETTNGMIYSNQGGRYVQLGKYTFGKFQEVQPIVCGNQRKIWGFGYRQNGRYYVQINENSYGPFTTAVEGPYISSNEKAFAFVYRNNGQINIQTNRKTYPQPPGGDFTVIGVECSENGKTIAIEFRQNGKGYIRVNEMVFGGRGTIYPDSLQLSNDGRYFGYRFYYNNQDCVQINDRVYRYDKVNSGDFVITPDNRICFANVKEGKVLIQEFN